MSLDAPDNDPVEQFRKWFRDAEQAGLRDPNAMALATASSAARPSVRMVLLKSFDERGFVFSTNYESRKAGELETNPRAALLFYWQSFDRQVRIEGQIGRTSGDESDAIFQGRPRGARLGAWASQQSRAIDGREELERRVQELERKHPDDVPRPPHWGGYRLRPDRFEFWLARPYRLHDRVRYRRGPGGGWSIDRLAP